MRRRSQSQSQSRRQKKGRGWTGGASRCRKSTKGTHARTWLSRDPDAMRCWAWLGLAWLGLAGCGTESASLLVTSAPVPRSLLNKKEERRSKQSQFIDIFLFSFPPNYVVFYCVALYCNYFSSSPFLSQPVWSSLQWLEVETSMWCDVIWSDLIREMSCFEAKDNRADLTAFCLQVIPHRHQRKAEVTFVLELEPVLNILFSCDSISLHYTLFWELLLSAYKHSTIRSIATQTSFVISTPLSPKQL